MKYLVLPLLVLCFIIASCSSSDGDGVIRYNGGSVITNPVNVYIIWYGQWEQNSNTEKLITYFLNHIDSTNYYKINESYYSLEDSRKIPISNKIRVIGNYYVWVPDTGSYLSKDDVPGAVVNSIVQLNLPADPDGWYLFLTDEYVQIESMCNTACGWHKFISVDTVVATYAVVINTEICPHHCHSNEFWSANDGGAPSSPNHDLAADGMIDVISHELSETLTDPFETGWNGGVINKDRIEVADKCEWEFGETYYTFDNMVANIRVGQKDFLIQELWYIDQNGVGYCTMSP